MTAPASTSTPSPTTPARFRIPGLDGVRAIAVSTVVVFHLVPGTLVGGYLGVDIFFVVSGFLITTLLLRERAQTGRISLRGFWTRRARRLLPALALLLLTCCAAALAVGGDVLVGLGMQVIGAITFSSNWLFIAAGNSYFDETVPEVFRNLWSLAVEEQFYVVWPVLVVLLLVRIPRVARLVLIAALAIASAVWMGLAYTPLDATRVYYGTETHAFGLAIGAFLAVLVDRPATRGVSGRVGRWTLAPAGGLALMGLLTLALVMPGDLAETYRGGLALVAVLTAVVIGSLLVPGSPVARVLDAAPLRWIGERSYGIYLWHWPVFVLLGSALPTWPRHGGEAWALGGIALAITLAAAMLSYRLVEQPIRRHGFRGTARAVLDAAPRSRRAIGAIVAMFVGVALATSSILALASDPGRGEAQAWIEAGQDAIDSAIEETPPPPHDDAPTEPEPTLDDLRATGDQISAIGDSAMLAAAPALQERFPGISIDAAVSRNMGSAPAIVQSQLEAGVLREVVVIALGTNGPIERSTLEHVRAMIGPRRELIVVNAQAPRGWIPGVNAELANFALVYRNVELANWHDAIQPFLHEMARDQVHFGPIGAGIYATALDEAVGRLAALPPLRDDSTDLSLPTPF